MKKIMQKSYLHDALVVGICFLLTSTAYLAWTYHIMEMTTAPVTEAVTLIVSYLFQTAGIGLFSLLFGRRADLIQKSFYAALVLHLFFLIPSVLCSKFASVFAFGCLMNILCGWIAGFYLYRLAAASDAGLSALTLGIGYSAAIIATWLLSLVGKDALHTAWSIMAICLILTAGAFAAVRKHAPAEVSPAEEVLTEKIQLPQEAAGRQFLILTGILVLLLSAVNSCGFSFPSDDIRNGISVEFSRLFYAAGLLIAGYANHKNRRYGAVCAVIALIVPFFMLAVRGEPVSGRVFWALGYFASGFYSVYRIILFTDIARETSLMPLSAFGLLAGRIGDAAGEFLCLALSGHVLLLAGCAALLFIVSMIIFFRVYRVLYVPVPKKQKSEQEIFIHFSERYDLSAREREVLRFLLDSRTNQEIADELCISDGTVKYHIHNLLQKTRCPNRLKLLAAYEAEKDL